MIKTIFMSPNNIDYIQVWFQVSTFVIIVGPLLLNINDNEYLVARVE